MREKKASGQDCRVAANGPILARAGGFRRKFQRIRQVFASACSGFLARSSIFVFI
jgi:hypothetical protein